MRNLQAALYSCFFAASASTALAQQPSTSADTAGAGFGIVLILFMIVAGLLFYFLPLIVAINRKVVNKGGVIVINVFLGWTFIGWIVALVMAFSGETEDQARSKAIDYDRLAHVMQNRPQQPPPPVRLP